jgi:transcriptional antiterminator RfaH
MLTHQISFFLPQCERRWRAQGRLRCSHVPLFPGYIFLRGDSDARTRVLETNLVSRFLEVKDQARLHADLARVYRLIEGGAPLTPEDRLAPGTEVEITCGALAGVRGKILSKGKQLKFVVEVQFLQRGVSVEIESWMIEPISDRRHCESTR